MSKWLNRLLEKEARKPQIDKEVSMVSMVPSLSTSEKCEIDKKSLNASTTAPSQSFNKEDQYLKKIEIPYHQNHRNPLSEKSETSLEMQGNVNAIANNQKLIPRLPRVKPLPKQDFNTEKINLKPIESHYPNLLPADEYQWIMKSVIAASDIDQANWWPQLELWAENPAENLKADDIAWRQTVYQGLKAEWHRRTSIRVDFLMATQMFAGRVLGNR